MEGLMTAQVKRFPKLSPEIKEQLRDDAAFNRLQAAARKADLLSYAIGGRMALEARFQTRPGRSLRRRAPLLIDGSKSAP